MKKVVISLCLLLVLPALIFAQANLLGDVNHSGSVSITDALMIAQSTVGTPPSGYYASEADVNCSGSVTIVDALIVAQYTVALITQFPCEPTPGPSGTPTPTTTDSSDLPAPATSGIPKPNGSPGNLKVLNWAGFKGAVSYTFDDANTSQINNYDRLNGLGVRFTFYLWTGKSEARNSIWGRAANDGHELGNHTQNHQGSASGSDIDAATNFIKQNFGVTPYTMAAPYGDTSYISPAQSRFLLNRGVSGGSIAPNDNSNAFNLPGHIPQTNASASALNNVADSARNQGRWQIYTIHGFTGGNDGAYQPIDINQFISHVQHVKGHGDVWIDSAENVGAYWRGQKTFSGVNPSPSGSSTTWRWTLPANYPPGKYLRVTVDGGTLLQNGEALQWDDHGYYEVALDKGSLTLSP